VDVATESGSSCKFVIGEQLPAIGTSVKQAEAQGEWDAAINENTYK
jgi:hypothetical protein